MRQSDREKDTHTHTELFSIHSFTLQMAAILRVSQPNSRSQQLLPGLSHGGQGGTQVLSTYCCLPRHIKWISSSEQQGLEPALHLGHQNCKWWLTLAVPCQPQTDAFIYVATSLLNPMNVSDITRGSFHTALNLVLALKGSFHFKDRNSDSGRSGMLPVMTKLLMADCGVELRDWNGVKTFTLSIWHLYTSASKNVEGQSRTSSMAM